MPDMTPFTSYVHKSKYARFLEESHRREHLPETIDRYLDFMEEHLKENNNYTLPKELKVRLRTAISNFDIMPSMRSVMTAGKALKRDSTCGYNCAYLVIDDVKAFDEAMFILMCGTGVGFSVERQYVNKLPEIPDKLFDSDTMIIVKDSKEGWAKALRQLIALLYSGEIPRWDLSKLRPKGARLKTFGGRSSGPGPLDELFKFIVHTFKQSAGIKLTSIDCHDIMCKIGQTIVVGGVRRSAMISLSNLSDDRMRLAKSGAWWNAYGHRALSNNSAVYTEKPDMGIFMEEWISLYNSKSGERGIFNREACESIIERTGRRELGHEWGVNPSLRAGTKVWTSEGIMNIDELEGKNFKTRNLYNEIVDATCWLSGNNKKLLQITLQGGHQYYATEEHKWPVYRNGKLTKVTTPELRYNDYLPTVKNEEVFTGELGDYDDGFLIGWNLGDGWITERKDGIRQYGFIVSDEKKTYGIDSKIQKILEDKCGYKGSILNKNEINISNFAINELFNKFSITHKRDGLPKALWKDFSEKFIRGLIDGLFSSDGHIECRKDKNNYVNQNISLYSCHENLIRDISEILGFYGIKNGLTYRSDDSYQFQEKRYDKFNECYSLYISAYADLMHFSKIFTLSNQKHQDKINSFVEKNPKNDNKIQVISVKDIGLYEDCWDIKVFDDTHCFQLSQCITGNCSEIVLRPMQFCNLSEVIVRSSDTNETIKEKIKLATILGTFQATMTKFPYLRKVWKQNTEEERLLGVSLTGIYDNPITCKISKDLAPRLESFKQCTIDTNKEYAEILGIPQSVAITCVKPSGTVSSLVNAASGIHPRFAQYYIRRARSDISDPLTTHLIQNGIYHEVDVTNPHAVVFSFPIKSEPNAVTRNDISAIEHLELWLMYQKHYCVSGDTQILTDIGYHRIDELVGKNITIWNGQEWSNTVPFKTGIQKIFRVKFSDGTEIKMTSDHKIVLKNGEKVHLSECEVGDCISDFNLPIISNTEQSNDLPDAYSQGFYSGDGYAAGNWSLISAPKYVCMKRLKGVVKENITSNRGRYWKHGDIGHLPKNFVPLNSTIDYKIDWLAGIIDSDGCKLGKGLHICAVDRQFLDDIRLMLTTIGVKSRLGNPQPPREYGISYYQYLFISGKETTKLINLGLECERVELEIQQNKSSLKSISIDEIEELGYEETYCFTEHKNHTGIFNGIMLGQCEHKPSVTINVKEDEWFEVGAWCYKNFDWLSGVSFLPYDGGTYQQAPYEEITKEAYEKMLAEFPKQIDWDNFEEFDDNAAGSQELACVSGGGCDIL